MNPRKALLACLFALLASGLLSACAPQEADAPDSSPAPSDSVQPAASSSPSANPVSVQPAAPESGSPAPQQSASPEQSPAPEDPSPEQPDQNAPEQSPSPAGEENEVLAAFAAALNGLYYDHVYPNGDPLFMDSFEESEMALNRFAIYDVDGDGQDELLFMFTNTITAGMTLTVYRYAPNLPGSLMVELMEYPGVTFYDNGAAMAGLSHNHSMGELWPYFLYCYDPVSDTYEYVAYAESWEKAISPDGFPDDIDADGDGVVYLYDVGPDTQYLDGPAYQAWFDSWVGDASPIDVPFQDFTPENISALR